MKRQRSSHRASMSSRTRTAAIAESFEYFIRWHCSSAIDTLPAGIACTSCFTASSPCFEQRRRKKGAESQPIGSSLAHICAVESLAQALDL